MYAVSNLWNTIVSQPEHWFEVSVVIGETGALIDKSGDRITFGGTAILVSQAGPDSGFPESMILELSTELRAFSGEQPSVGGCLSTELKVRMLRPAGDIPRMAMVRPYVRVTAGTQTSEWIPQGLFYIDTRETTQNDDGLVIITIHAYDAMLMTEQDYPDTTHEWPMTDTDVVQEIADAIGVAVDPRTWDVMGGGYQISTPLGYSMREVLGNIAAMYAGNWIMNYDGELLLVALNSMPGETNYLVDEYGFDITFGGDRILV